MSAIHVIVRPQVDSIPVALEPLRALFDVVVDGVNLTARVGEAHALPVLAELGHAVAALGSGRRTRACVQLYAEQELWELGLEADGDAALITVFRNGPVPDVAVFERHVPLTELRAAVERALAESMPPGNPPVAAALTAARRALTGSPLVIGAPRPRIPLALTPRSVRGVALSARGELRRVPADPEQAGAGQLERADLHALLCQGELGLTIRGRTQSLGSVHLFLLAERLLALAAEAVDAWHFGRPFFRRTDLGSVRVAVQRGPGDAPLSLSVTAPATASERVTFPELDARALAEAVIRWTRGLADALIGADPGQAHNLRLIAAVNLARALGDRVLDATVDDTLTNSEPDSYRSFSSPPGRTESRGRWEHGGKMRFVPRWVATVPAIDLRSTFLCGDRLIVGSERETACIHRAAGTLLWRVPSPRSAAVATPSGLARIGADGRITLLGLDDGQARFSVALKPRVGGGAAGAVVHSPALPKLLVVAEGERQITAIDLVSGQVRWRHTLRRPGPYRMRRAGKLLLCAGDSALTALDVTTGEAVWRLCDRLQLTGDLAIDHDSAFAVASSPGGGRLLHLDPWTGHLRWSAELEERPAVGQPPLVMPEAVAVPLRDRRGAGLTALDRHTGAKLWDQAPGLAAPSTAWLAVDGNLIGNSASGTLMSIEGTTGATRFSHVFPRHVDADQPRRLEPVLRSGALFVPQHRVHVVRPRDGEILGTVPTDLIPDLLRVDERCDVYVAEESGHVAGFGVAPRLTLVK